MAFTPNAVNESNFVLGPADVYIAPFGTALPTDAETDPNTAFVGVGATNGGVKLTITETVTDLVADQVLMPVGGRVTAQEVQVAAALSEITMSNMVTAIASHPTYTPSAVPGTDDNVLTASTATSQTQPQYQSIVIDGWAPRGTSGTPLKRRIVISKTVPQTSATLTFDKATQQSLDVTFKAYYDAGNPSWAFYDATSALVNVTNPGSQSGTVGSAITALHITATDSESLTLTYSAEHLPPGLSIASSTGIISGTPTTAGSYSVIVQATDTSGAYGTAAFTWTIAA